MVSPLINFLLKPESYPHHPEKIQHIQTHISHVFIAPPYVYKIKKPLNLDFLDFSTLQKRLYYCRREVELNRRLCSDTYLGIVPVYRDDVTFQIGELDSRKPNQAGGERTGQKSKPPVEYAVVMKQLARENFLIEKIRTGQFHEHHLDQVADRLASFYRQKPDKEIQKFGEPEKIRFNSDENFRQTQRFVGSTLSENSFRAIRRFANGFLERNRRLLEKRVSDHRIVDGHGDLHLEHIHINGDNVCIYDCIEFNQRFRMLDVAADLAFLTMDLDYVHLQRASRNFTMRMAETSDDPDLLDMMDFYKCNRAFIRGKVKSIESTEKEIPESDRKKAADKASGYFNLALRYSLFGSEPVVLIFMGRVGSGKSTLADSLAGETGLDSYSTDRIRKEAAGISPTTYLADSKRQKLYRTEVTERTYNTLFKKGLEEIQEARSVILDGTFSSREIRDHWISRFEEQNIDYLFVEVTADNQIRKQRLLKRKDQKSIVSDARIEEMEKLDKHYAETDHIPSARKVQIDSSRRVEESLETLCRFLTRRNLANSEKAADSWSKN